MNSIAMDPESNTQAAELRPGSWSPKYVWLLIVLAFSVEFVLLTALYPINALGQIGTHFGTDQVAWIPAALTLGGAVLGPLIGKIADKYGKKKILVIVLAFGVVGMVISAFAPTFLILLAGRVIQAPVMAVGFIVPSIVRDVFPSKLVAFAVVATSGGASFISVIAQLLTGTVIENLGYQGTFWLPAVVGAVVFVLVLVSVPDSNVRDTTSKIDVTGAMLLGGGVGVILLGVSFGHPGAGPRPGCSSPS